MRQISLPLPTIDDAELIEIDVKTEKQNKIVQFRIQSFSWKNDEETSNKKSCKDISYLRILSLKKSIESYDKSWELIQIFAPLENSGFIRVLYRKQL
jgi:hypothetical protein